MNTKKYLPITISSLYIGLKNYWLTSKEVTNYVNSNSSALNLDEKDVLEININDDDRAIVLEILSNRAEISEDIGLQAWQLANLLAIEESDLNVSQKLIEVESIWATFGYPDSWKDFIYYMPNEKVNTQEGLYDIFLKFISEERKKIW